jgi:hypothetical protein
MEQLLGFCVVAITLLGLSFFATIIALVAIRFGQKDVAEKAVTMLKEVGKIVARKSGESTTGEKS